MNYFNYMCVNLNAFYKRLDFSRSDRFAINAFSFIWALDLYYLLDIMLYKGFHPHFLIAFVCLPIAFGVKYLFLIKKLHQRLFDIDVLQISKSFKYILIFQISVTAGCFLFYSYKYLTIPLLSI